jgi:hypothetical protein
MVCVDASAGLPAGKGTGLLPIGQACPHGRTVLAQQKMLSAACVDILCQLDCLKQRHIEHLTAP